VAGCLHTLPQNDVPAPVPAWSPEVIPETEYACSRTLAFMVNVTDIADRQRDADRTVGNHIGKLHELAAGNAHCAVYDMSVRIPNVTTDTHGSVVLARWAPARLHKA
jgi:hypothetical protein